MIIAGIDEAGLGPVLGPLVISSAAFRVEDTDDEVDLWDRLGGAVARSLGEIRRRKLSAAIAIADSKALFNRNSKRGIAPLEQAVLTLLAIASKAGELPATLGELLDLCCDGSRPRAGAYPWYGECELALPLKAGATDIGFATNAVRVAMRRAKLEFSSLRAEPLFVGEYNQLVGATHNKATAAFGVVARLLAELWALADRCGEKQLRVVVDRQGGRMRYREPLQRMFPDGRLRILEESDTVSRYHIERGESLADVSFEVQGDSHSLPTALASMLSKYIRECCMTMFNAFWAGHVEGLAPTAGYHEDGNRFVEEIAPTAERLGIARGRFYRQR
jgi:ribonuclease HII